MTSAGPSLPRASSQPVSVIRSTSTSQLSSSPPPSSADTSQAQKSEDQSSLQSSQLSQSSQTSLIMSGSSHASSQLSWLSSPPIVISDEEDEYEEEEEDDASLPSQDPKRPRLARDSQGAPVMPDLLAGVRIPEAEGGARTGDECPVCLDPPLHSVTLPCGHIFCFLCAKASLNTSHVLMMLIWM